MLFHNSVSGSCSLKLSAHWNEKQFRNCFESVSFRFYTFVSAACGKFNRETCYAGFRDSAVCRAAVAVGAAREANAHDRFRFCR